MALGDLLGRLSKALGRSTPGKISHPLLDAFLTEGERAAPSQLSAPKIGDVATGRAILEEAPEEQARILREAALALCISLHGPRPSYLRADILKTLCSRLMRKSLPLTEEDVVTMLSAFSEASEQFWHWLPVRGLVNVTERYVERHGLSESLQPQLELFRDRGRSSEGAEMRHMAARVDRLLAGPLQSGLVARSPWGDSVSDWLDSCEVHAKESWVELLRHAASAGGRSRPTKRWTTKTLKLIDDVAPEHFSAQLATWLDELTLDPEHPDENSDVLKGLIWAAGGVSGTQIGGVLGRFAHRCFDKVPGIGARSIKLGNASILALSQLANGAGIAELSRLQNKVRYVNARSSIRKLLENAAEASGKSMDELLEQAVPDHGLDTRGRREERVGDSRGLITVTDSGQVELKWIGRDDKVRKTVPPTVKSSHPDVLKQLRTTVKEIRASLLGQRDRLERLLPTERGWRLDEWRNAYLTQPVVSCHSRRLIWRFANGERETSAMALGDDIVDQNGEVLDWLDDGSRVSLWHPILESPENVLAWRRRLTELAITQPFKQAHREIYLLTEAERATEVYSNRFAAHILKQHQFRALCQQRGWHYDLQGAWDSHNVPHRKIDRHDLVAEFWVEPVVNDDVTESFVYTYLSSDQVRFVQEDGSPVALRDVPPLVFSELMRDVDLFVGVSSIGNDPNWVDGQSSREHLDYWESFSFGDLPETAKTRRSAIEEILPRLKISDRCSIDGRFLRVRGKRGCYKIHLGSSNVLMEPNDHYLCIVRGSSAKSHRVQLPFEGDSTLSLILSKAFMLAADDKITDDLILSQIERGGVDLRLR